MNLQITGDNYHLSNFVKRLIDEKVALPIDKLLTTFDPELRTASLKISRDKIGTFLVNYDMSLPGKTHIYAEAKHLVLKSALIDLTQEVEKQIKRYKQELANYSLG